MTAIPIVTAIPIAVEDMNKEKDIVKSITRLRCRTKLPSESKAYITFQKSTNKWLVRYGPKQKYVGRYSEQTMAQKIIIELMSDPVQFFLRKKQMKAANTASKKRKKPSSTRKKKRKKTVSSILDISTMPAISDTAIEYYVPGTSV